MNVTEFIKKWRKVTLTERSASQQHFLDLCALLDHPTPAAADPEGSSFTFEKGAHKRSGGDGWADVWKQGCFGWEYKGKHKDLDAAYDQLQQYREDLENPPLLVVSDMARIIIHTNFTGRRTEVHEIPLEAMGEADNLRRLRDLFRHPERFEPGVKIEEVTRQAAEHIAAIAQRLRDRGLDPHVVARFLDRIVFCLFAEDTGLLPDGLFTDIIRRRKDDPERFARVVRSLFEAMAEGGDFGALEVRHFNGDLFRDVEVLDLTEDEIEAIHQAARLDWSAIQPSIFGTLFERGLDPGKRAQLGAHYTSEADIRTLVEPVVMAPLRREWDELRATLDNLCTTATKTGKRRSAKPPTAAALKQARREAGVMLGSFLQRLSRVKVLDPACGSGNFLYVTLLLLKDLEKQAIIYGRDSDLGSFLPFVSPTQLHGIEINPYAFELAQMTVWIGWLQWTRNNGFGWPADPVLRPMDTFENKDAILDLSDPQNPREPTWPKVDFIVGNPPFLGDKKLRAELGDQYVDSLWGLYAGAVPQQSDLCCYWFEKARRHVEAGQCHRAGLLATQGIRGGQNRVVLQRIQDTGSIFFAVSDRDWVLDGAAVHISMVGFDGGAEQSRTLDGEPVSSINPNLSASADTTRAVPLGQRLGQAFIGVSQHGPFELDDASALVFLRSSPNPHGKPNSDVVRPIINAFEIVRRPGHRWVVAFEPNADVAEAALYEAPFEYVVRNVRPVRENNRRKSYRDRWWLHGEARPAMQRALHGQRRFLATPRVAKHRVFVWIDSSVLPSDAVVAIAVDTDLVFGVLQSRPQELWGLRLGTRLETRPRYTPTTCFETFPFPVPTSEQSAAIAEAARELNALRERWLNPPEWVREEILEFPGTVGGPWTRYMEEGSGLQVPGSREEGEPEAGARNPEPETRNHPRTGTVRYPRLVPRDAECAAKLKTRTLTKLYNARPAWLDLAHRTLDAAVSAAYGWPPDLGDEAILERLLALNLERAAAEGTM